jgi:hypothetical protein
MTLFSDLDSYFEDYMYYWNLAITRWNTYQETSAAFVYETAWASQEAYSTYVAALAIHEAAVTVVNNLWSSALSTMETHRDLIINNLPDSDIWFKVSYSGTDYGIGKTADDELLIVPWTTSTVSGAATATAAAYITDLHPAGGIVADEGTATAAGVAPAGSGTAAVTGVVVDAPAAGIAPVVTGS